MHFKAEFRRLVAGVNLSDPASWRDPKAAKVAIDGSRFLSDDDRQFFSAIFGLITDESEVIIRRLGSEYLSSSVENMIVLVLNRHRSEHVSPILALKRAIRKGQILTHRVQNMRRVGKKGVEEILEFLGIS